jgi:FkbM family methyltransferase
MEELDPSFEITYAQNREDIILDFFFRDVPKGFYIDVGAGHPDEDSVTKLFYDKGWRGINVEPIRRMYSLLQKNRPRDINLNIGLSDKKGKLNFREYGNYGQSTFNEDMKKEHRNSLKSTDKYEDYEVQVDTLANILSQHKVEAVHFLKIDVEGLEYEVLKGNDWHKYRPEVLCIEANHIIKNWRPLLKNHAYKRVFNDGLNDYYVSEDSSRARDFSYVGALLSDVRPIDYRVAAVVNKEISLLNSKIDDFIFKDSDQSLKIDYLEHEVNRLTSQLASYRSARSLIRALLAKINRSIEEHIYPSKFRKQLALAPQDVKLTLHNDVLTQLKEINEYDQANLSEIKIASHPIRASILWIYLKINRLMIRSLRIILRAIRKIKRIASRQN